MGNTKDLLHGNIKRELIALMLPLILGNILQQLYNTIDAMIVGRYVGSTAFAAVGVAGSIMNLFIFILNGSCNGISVVFAEIYGQRASDRFRRESFVSLFLGIGLSAGLSLLSLGFLHTIIQALKTPPEVAVYAQEYLVIILAGLPVTFLYNWCAAVLQAVGDTKTPLYTLLLAMSLNTGLDLVFVVKFQWETAGTAAATVLAQSMAFVWCLWVMKRRYPGVFPKREDLVLEKKLVRRTAKFGAVSALHQSSLYIGKLLVQGAVNTGGTDMISAYTATMRIEGFANSFSDSGASALSVFVAQNRGSGNKDRAKKGFRQGLFLMLILAVLLSVLMAVVTKAAVAVLMGQPSEAVLQNAEAYMFTISVFYILCFTGSTFVGFFRGMGRIEVPVIGSVLQITIRVVLSYLWIDVMGLKAVALATGAGWMSIVVYQVLTYRCLKRRGNSR